MVLVKIGHNIFLRQARHVVDYSSLTRGSNKYGLLESQIADCSATLCKVHSGPRYYTAGNNMTVRTISRNADDELAKQ